MSNISTAIEAEVAKIKAEVETLFTEDVKPEVLDAYTTILAPALHAALVQLEQAAITAITNYIASK